MLVRFIRIVMLLLSLITIALAQIVLAQDENIVPEEITPQNAAEVQYLGQIAGDEAPITTVYFTPDETVMVLGGMNMTVYLDDGSQGFFDGGAAADLCIGYQTIPNAAAINLYLTCDVDSADHFILSAWEGDEISAQPIIEQDFTLDQITAAAISAEGAYFALGRIDGALLLWDLSTMQVWMLREPIADVQQVPLAIAFSPDQTRLAVMFSDTFFIWDISGEEPELLSEASDRLTTTLTYSPDGSQIAAANPNTLYILDGDSGFFEAELAGRYEVTYSPDGSLIAAPGDDGITLWSTDDFEVVAVLETPDGVIQPDIQLAFSRDGRLLVAASTDAYFWGLSAAGLEDLLLQPEAAATDSYVVDPTLAEEGEQIFFSSQCSGCHMYGFGTGPSLEDIAQNAALRVPEMRPQDYLYESIVDPRAYVVDGYIGGAHPGGYGDWYTEPELQAMVAYLMRLHYEFLAEAK